MLELELTWSSCVIAAVANGGYVAAGRVGPTDYYDVLSGTWTTGSSMATLVQDHKTVTLPSGSLLAIGGLQQNFAVPNISQVLDPVSKTWANTNGFPADRHNNDAVVLNNGNGTS